MAASRKAARAGDEAKALRHAFLAVKQEPRSFEPLFLLAAALHKAGRCVESIPYYERAIRANAAVADPQHNLGCALLAVGRAADAEAPLRAALALRPDYAAALDALGFSLAEQGRTDEALQALERSVELDAANATSQGRLGHIYLRLLRFDAAAARFAAGLALVPTSHELLDGLGIALDRLGRTDDAIVMFRAALASDPNDANAACNLGKALLEIGDIDEAMSWFERAIALNPRDGTYYLGLVTGDIARVKPEHIARMVELGVDISTLPRAQQIAFHFALGNAYEREGRFDDAFAELAAGNALQRAELAYDERAALAYVISVINAFGNPLLAELRGSGDPSARPLFICGMPRSGSTLVEQLLAAHPAVASAGECGVLGPIVREVWPKIAAQSIAELGAGVRAIGERYLRETDALAAGKSYLTDKTLENVQLAPLINVMLPNARIIHIRRDDLDTCFSNFATFFADGKVPFAYDLGELGRYYRGYLTMMDCWNTLLPPERMLEVRYEALVANFEEEARRIIAFCGLPWDPACLEFHKVRRTVRTASNAQVRQPLYSSAVGRAQHYRTHLGPLIEALHGA